MGPEANLVTEAARRDAFDNCPGIRVKPGDRQAGTRSQTRFVSEYGTNLDSDVAATDRYEICLGGALGMGDGRLSTGTSPHRRTDARTFPGVGLGPLASPPPHRR